MDRRESDRDTDTVRTDPSLLTDEVTDGDFSDVETRRKKRRRRTRSPSLAYHSVTQRISLASPSLSVTEERLVEEGELTASSGSSLNFRSLSRDKKLTVINFCTTNLCVGCFYSLLGPFFPTEAAKKGVSTTLVGLIFGAFELTVVLTSPILGRYMTQIGAKFMYVSGVMVCGSGAILFGFLDRSPDGTIYIVMCFLVRVVEACGAAALLTSSFAVIANTFPDNVATMFGTLELFSGLGLMIGPPLGGALFQLGGFMVPFVSLGCVMVLVGLASTCVLPPQNFDFPSAEQSMFALLRIPVVSLMGLCLMSGSASIGFIDVTLSIYLNEQYNLSPVILGVVFLVGPGVYALTAPMWGWFVDRTPKYNKMLICFGYTMGGLGFYLMGPAPFLPIPHELWLVIVSLALMGFGISTLVITFQVITEATKAAGYPEGLDTYGLIAGIFNAFFSLGAFAGPLGGGYLHDLLAFEMSAVVIGSCSLFAALLLLTYITVTACCLKKPTSAETVSERSKHGAVSEREPLLSNGYVSHGQYCEETESRHYSTADETVYNARTTNRTSGRLARTTSI